MPEPVTLSVVASTIAIAGLAYKSTKSLTNFIDSLTNAPKLIVELKDDIKVVQGLVKSIELMLENRDDRNLPRDLRFCLSSAKVPLEDCRAVSESFERTLEDWFNNSKSDKLKANRKETKVQNFRRRLADTRSALDLALNVCSIKFNGLRADEARKFEVEMEKQMHLVSGKLQGIEVGRQEILDAAENLNQESHQLSCQQEELVRRFTGHERLLREALKFCTAGLLETGTMTGNTVKLAKSMDEARQLVAYIGGVTGEDSGGIIIEQLIAQDKSKQVGITNDAEFALRFMNG